MIFLRDFDKNNEKLENFAKGDGCAVVPMHAPPLLLTITITIDYPSEQIRLNLRVIDSSQ